MAMADYRWCSGCGGKSFYDANLNYGKDCLNQTDNMQTLPEGCGDMRVLCEKCFAAGWTITTTPPIPTEGEK